ncbi:MAG: DNA alkylation repair protein [Rikenellaceae bacterium]
MEKEQFELIKISLLNNFRREMNGAVAGTMRQLSGLEGLQSYGVSLPTIKSICEKIERNHQFALFLFKSKVRELKIAATIIDPEGEVTVEQITSWCEDCDNIEILNSVARLAGKSSVAVKLFDKWIASKDAKYSRLALLIGGEAVRKGVEIDSYSEKVMRVVLDIGRGEINESVFALHALETQNNSDTAAIKKQLTESNNIFAAEVGAFIGC